MKQFILITALILLVVFPIEAQQNVVRVPYSRHVPAVVRQQVPPSGATKFFGSCKLSSLNLEALFHLYSAPAAAKEKPETEKAEIHIVDVWQRVHRGNQSTLKRLNSVRLELNNFKLVSADILWVDPDQQTMPVLRLHLFDPGGFYGTTGFYTLVNFPKGFSNTATVQTFNYWFDHYDAGTFRFDNVDERGFMVVSLIFRQNNDTPNNTTTTNYYWSGAEFSKDEGKK